jgi:hypothetical protein
VVGVPAGLAPLVPADQGASQERGARQLHGAVPGDAGDRRGSLEVRDRVAVAADVEASDTAVVAHVELVVPIHRRGRIRRLEALQLSIDPGRVTRAGYRDGGGQAGQARIGPRGELVEAQRREPPVGIVELIALQGGGGTDQGQSGERSSCRPERREQSREALRLPAMHGTEPVLSSEGGQALGVRCPHEVFHRVQRVAGVRVPRGGDAVEFT